MKDRRKTDNPYARLADRPGKSPNMYTAWGDGYKCGHSDAEMDEREFAAELRNDSATFRGNLMDKAVQIQTLEHDAKFLRATIKNLQGKLRNLREKHRVVVYEGTRKEAWDEGYASGIRQCNHHPEAMDNDSAVAALKGAREAGFDSGNEEGYADGLAEGKRRLEGLGEIGYDSGFIKGREAGIKEAEGAYNSDDLEDAKKKGFEEGRKYALHDWMMHFILYMQESGESFAVCQLSDLEDMREAVRELQSKRNNLEDGTAVFEEHLTDIEAVLTKLEVVDR